eukprot:11795097-Ditylum_brightwellii.AAC.1
MKLHNQLQKDKNLVVGRATFEKECRLYPQKQGGGDPPGGCKICRKVVRKFVTGGKWLPAGEPGCQVANFTAIFSKIGYMGIKWGLDKHKVEYMKHTIIQSLDLKRKLEKLGLKGKEVALMLLDIVNMYPYVRVKLIKKELQRIKLEITMVQFGMKNTLVNFCD